MGEEAFRGLAILTLFVFAYSLVSRRLTRTIITGPIVFTTLGLLLGPGVLGALEFEPSTTFVRVLAEVTLVLVLFTDAARIKVRDLVRHHSIPSRLLLVSLPLQFAVGACIAWLLFRELDIWSALVLAAVLAPTDAALGQAVVTNERVPQRIRQSLNIESGTNDGLVVPFLVFFEALAVAEEGVGGPGDLLLDVAVGIGLGILVGTAIGFVGGRLIDSSSERGWIGGKYKQIATLALALAAWAVADLAGGNGFIAAFAGGITVGNVVRPICGPIWEFSEEEGSLLTLLTFFVFGAFLAGLPLDDFRWEFLVYAALSLTVVRAVPTVVSLVGMRLRFDTQAYIAWFGPRGLASVVFALEVFDNQELLYAELIYSAAFWTILVSVYAHGFTSEPLSERYADRIEAASMAPDAPELVEVPHVPTKSRPRPRWGAEGLPAE